jgi:hypothetical protein
MSSGPFSASLILVEIVSPVAFIFVAFCNKKIEHTARLSSPALAREKGRSDVQFLTF